MSATCSYPAGPGNCPPGSTTPTPAVDSPSSCTSTAAAGCSAATGRPTGRADRSRSRATASSSRSTTGGPPRQKFPGPLDDCVQAVRWLAGHPHTVEADGEHVVLMGDSAGGNLAAATTL